MVHEELLERFICWFVRYEGEAACNHQLSLKIGNMITSTYPPGNKRPHQKSVLAAAMTRGSCGSVESALTALYYTCKNRA